MNWLIAIPAWGERCVQHARHRTLPAVRAALSHAGASAEIICHTDMPSEFKKETLVTPLPLPGPQRSSFYYKMSDCHRDVLKRAKEGQWVAFINADNIPSREVFEAAAKHFNAGKHFVMMNGMRTLSDEPPRPGLASADLLDWAWAHRHPTMEDAVWGRGGTTSLATIYFEQGDNVICRGFHLHPLACTKRVDDFKGVTLDDGLIEQYAFDEIHVITDRDEAAMIECSPADRKYGHRNVPFNLRSIALWAASKEATGRVRASAHHRWMFGHRIVIKGDGRDVGDVNVCNEALAMANSEKLF